MELAAKQKAREEARHYIVASDEDISAMLNRVGVADLESLFAHIPAQCRIADGALNLPLEKDYADVEGCMSRLAGLNRRATSFIGDGLPDFSTHEIVPYVSSIRTLSTSYTPYQPERSQGTLYCHWIYQCVMAELTGFEAVNSSLYDRASALYEAMAMAQRTSRSGNTILISEGVFPGDLEVVETLARHTPVKLVKLALDPHSGRTDVAKLEAAARDLGPLLAGIVVPQVNCLGILEEVDSISDLCSEVRVPFIAVIDPLLNVQGGLKPPSQFGKEGASIIVGEGQHLAIAPNFGGPGLGVFAVRYNEQHRTEVRQTPGRYVGKAKDVKGRDCRVMVMSTREQHIRKDKATSNICSNQAFIATLVGASLLARGADGLAEIVGASRKAAMAAAERLTAISGIKLAYPTAAFFNEFTIELPLPAADFLKALREKDIHGGVDVSDRVAGARQLVKLSFTDKHDDTAVQALIDAVRLTVQTSAEAVAAKLPELPKDQVRADKPRIPKIPLAELKDYYERLGALNATPDAAPYPLGSCTMKYNPEINDWAASLPGFTDIHPQAPVEDAQGCLELLYEIQEWFKGITGLAAVTTQPVAGAQGELVGLKLFQAYHEANGEDRDVILLPRSAHGTNFATASMTGYLPNGKGGGIVLLEADDQGQIDAAAFEAVVTKYDRRIAGIMVTNPNTSGIFETRFREMADRIHSVGGLVYMDGANMNAIAGWVNLEALGVDAVHNNLHKTWTIPHGGGGPGDAIVAVSERLKPFLPGYVIEKQSGQFVPVKAPKSIGSFHRHWGNFAHKVRAYTYLLRLGKEGVQRMSAVAVLASRYVFESIRHEYLSLPRHSSQPRMHEFIVTLKDSDFAEFEHAGVQRPSIITGMGKLFLDFGYHAPTMSWPEAHGMMIEPTESYTKAELDRFSEAVLAIIGTAREHPRALSHAPYFMPVARLDEVSANRSPQLHGALDRLPDLPEAPEAQIDVTQMPIHALKERLEVALRAQ